MRKLSKITRMMLLILFWLAILIPPWNIFWWLVGILLHLTGINKRFDGGNDPDHRFIFYIAFAPAVLPLLPFMAINDLMKSKKEVPVPKLNDSPEAEPKKQP